MRRQVNVTRGEVERTRKAERSRCELPFVAANAMCVHRRARAYCALIGGRGAWKRADTLVIAAPRHQRLAFASPRIRKRPLRVGEPITYVHKYYNYIVTT